jgi:hypothetical protein
MGMLACSARHYFIVRNRKAVLGTAELAMEEDPQQSWPIDWAVEKPLDGKITCCFSARLEI